MSREDIEKTIRQYIATECLNLQDPDVLKSDTELLNSKILDSLNLMNLIAFIEKEFSVAVKDSAITEDNFSTIACISGYIAGHTNP